MGLKRLLLTQVGRITIKSILLCCKDERLRKEIGEVYRLARKSNRHNERIKYLSQYKIHESVKFGYHTTFYGNGSIEIGADSYFGHNCFISSRLGGDRIVIGEGCSISHNVHLRTGKHKRVFHFRDERGGDPASEDILIGSYVWIGANVFISGGIAIGDNVIIGANSVVTKDLPDNTIWGGVPAQLIRDKKEYLND